MIPPRLPRTARVRARAEFDRIFKHGRRVALPVLALHVCPPAQAESPARLGLAVSRKVDPHAVGRNRIKRVLRAAFREHRAALPPADYVVVARPGASACDGVALRAAFERLLKRAGALPDGATAVTMPAAAVTGPDAGPSAPSRTTDSDPASPASAG
ncbi:ribonuclease P protein component [Lysobacter sp. A3-1-A15]|uniref:ribonuclease P protein component n=1 Tax=Novilysobacter viscosus TaxID=3098602 RepID=UPI002ED99618